MTTTNYLYIPDNPLHIHDFVHLRCNMYHAWKYTRGDAAVKVTIYEEELDVSMTTLKAPVSIASNVSTVVSVAWGIAYGGYYSHGTNVYGQIFDLHNTGHGKGGVAPDCNGAVYGRTEGYPGALNFATLNNYQIASFSVNFGSTDAQAVLTSATNFRNAGGLIVHSGGNGSATASPQIVSSSTSSVARHPETVLVGNCGGFTTTYDNPAYPWAGGQGTAFRVTVPTVDMVVAQNHVPMDAADIIEGTDEVPGGTYTANMIGGSGPNYSYGSFWGGLCELNGQFPDSNGQFTAHDGTKFTGNTANPYYGVATSFGTPYVAGILALIKSINTALTPTQLRDILYTTVNKGKHSTYATYYPNAGVANAGKAVAKARSTRTDNLNVIIPCITFSGTGVSVNNTSLNLNGDVYIDCAGFKNGADVAVVELKVGSTVVYRGAPLDVHFPNATSGTNLLTITAYDSTGASATETYIDILVGSLGTASNVTTTTTNYNGTHSTVYPSCDFIPRMGLPHAWKYTTGSKSIKMVLANITQDTQSPLLAGIQTPDYTWNADNNTTTLIERQTDGGSHANQCYTIMSMVAPTAYLAIIQSVEPAARLAKAISIGAKIISDSDGTWTDGADAAGQASLQAFCVAAQACITAGIGYFLATDDNSGYNPMSPKQMYYDAPNHSYNGALDWCATVAGVQQVSGAGGNGKTWDTPWLKAADVHTTPIVKGQIPANEIWGYGEGIPFVGPALNILTNDGFNGWGYTSGTSFAAPLVASIAALVWSCNPNLTYQQVVSILHNTKSNGMHTNFATVFPSAGFPDAGRAVKMALSTANPTTVYPYVGLFGNNITWASNITTVGNGTCQLVVDGFCGVGSLTDTGHSNNVTSVAVYCGSALVYAGAPTTLNAIATSGTNNLTVMATTATGTVSEVYTDIQVGTLAVLPNLTISPTSGTYTSGQQITLSSNIAGYQIVYTLDGSEPVISSGTPTVLGVSGTIATGQTLAISGTNMVQEDKTNWDSRFKTGTAYGFEGANLAADSGLYWNPDGVYDSTVKLMGNNSIKFSISGATTGIYPNNGGTANYFAESSGDYWFRAYVRYNVPAGVWPDNYTKLFILQGSNTNYYAQFGMNGGSAPINMEINYNGTNYFASLPYQVQNNRWYLIECHIKGTSPTAFDLWFDGVQLFANQSPPAQTATYFSFGPDTFGATASGFALDNWIDSLTVSSSRIYAASKIEISGDGGTTWKYQPPTYLSDTSSTVTLDLPTKTAANYLLRVTNNKQSATVYTLV